MKCDVCGKEFKEGNRLDGIPNGVAFVMKDGTKLTMCADCIMMVGQEQEEKRDKE